MSRGLERSESVLRRPLPSNTASIVYDELRDPTVIEAVLKSVEAQADWAKIRVIFGGNDSRFSFFTEFFETSPAAERITGAITSFARLRWLGVSKDTALNLIAIDPGAPPLENEQATALRRAAPWLPYSKLRPVRATELVAIYWAEDGTSFVFEDVDVSFVILFGEYGVRIEAMIYAVDSKEFAARTRGSVAEHAKAAKLRAREQSAKTSRMSAILFWRELKKTLGEHGIAWMSPEELNREISWH